MRFLVEGQTVALQPLDGGRGDDLARAVEADLSTLQGRNLHKISRHVGQFKSAGGRLSY